MTASRGKRAPAEQDRLMDTKQLSEFLQVPERTIEDWRRRSEGPAYVKLNGHMVRYQMSVVDAWLKTQTVGAA